ncbi:MAG: hypothetical protein HY315_04280 [Acidobacteria bacterium]|nr:hypothetical protein [Acidobacteriota bacterium]
MLGLAVGSASAQQRPLITEIPEPVAGGTARLELGVDFLQNQPFPLSGLRGDLTRIGVIGGRLGLGSRIEFEIQGTLGNFLSVKQREPAPFSDKLRFSGRSTHDIGDFLFATKIRLRQEADAWPSLSFRAGAILPNLKSANGLGINTNRILGGLLAGKHLGKTYFFSNLGILIIDNPTEQATQSDKLAYGLAFLHPLSRRIYLLGEIEGMGGNPHPGTEDVSRVRLGAQVRAGGLVWDFAGLAGLRKADPDSGVVFGITRDFQIFR